MVVLSARGVLLLYYCEEGSVALLAIGVLLLWYCKEGFCCCIMYLSMNDLCPGCLFAVVI